MTEKQTTLAILTKCGMDPSSHQYLMEAITEEMTRRREYIAGLEAVARLAVAVRKNFRYIDPPTFAGSDADDDYQQLRTLVRVAEAALSGGTAALDAVASEAVKEKVLEVVNAGNRLLDLLSEHPKWFETKAQQAWDELSIEILKARV